MLSNIARTLVALFIGASFVIIGIVSLIIGTIPAAQTGIAFWDTGLQVLGGLGLLFGLFLALTPSILDPEFA